MEHKKRNTRIELTEEQQLYLTNLIQRDPRLGLHDRQQSLAAYIRHRGYSALVLKSGVLKAAKVPQTELPGISPEKTHRFPAGTTLRDVRVWLGDLNPNFKGEK